MAMLDKTQHMRLIVDGAIAAFEGDGVEIGAMLVKKERSDLFMVYDMLGTALYVLKEMLADMK